MGLYLIIALFFCIYIGALENRYNNAFNTVEKSYIVKIISNREIGEYTNKYIAKIISENDKNHRVYLYTDSTVEYKYGDIIRVFGEIILPDKARNDKCFDYCKYLKTQKISALFFANREEYIKREESIISKIYDLKLHGINIIENNFELEEASILKGFLLGDSSSIDDKMQDVFSKSNLSHILAISGSHIVYIVFYLEALLKIIINNIKIRNSIIIVFLFIFTILVGTTPSAMRACFMSVICYVGKNVLRQNDFYRSFIFSFIIILIINPYNIYSVSMWLSYMGSLGIVLFSDFMQKLIIRKLRIQSKICKKVIEIIILSISAQFMIFPIMWFNFGSLSFSFWISNLLVSEIVAPMLVIRLHVYNNISYKRFFSIYRTALVKIICKSYRNFFENTF